VGIFVDGFKEKNLQQVSHDSDLQVDDLFNIRLEAGSARRFNVETAGGSRL